MTFYNSVFPHLRTQCVSLANKKYSLQAIFEQLSENQQKATAAAGLSSREKIHTRDSRKKKTPLMKTIPLTDVSGDLDLSHTVNKTNTLQNTRTILYRKGGCEMGEYVIYNTNLPENPERKGNAQFSYLGVVLDSVYLLIQSLCTKFFHCT